MSEEFKLREERPWGNFEIVKDTKDFKIKILTMNPHSKLSYQSHKHRNEFWIVLEGEALAIVNDGKYPLKKDMSICIKKEDKHRLINDTDNILRVLEIQTGESFEESDIFRFEDIYNRI